MNTKHFLRAMIAILSLAVAAPASAQCTGDLTGNGIVDGADLGTILAYWGPRTQDPTSIASDLNGDGLINGADLGVLLNAWGPCPGTITIIGPVQGCIAGGTRVTILGTGLVTTTEVVIGGMPATNVTVVNPTTVQATTPAGPAGPASVVVITAPGAITASQYFTYMPASVSSIIPNVGPPAGGTLIMISGAYLSLSTGVMVGGAPCTDVTVINANTVTAVTPAGAAGTADVVIMGGKGTIVAPESFRYATDFVPSWATLIEAQPDPSVVPDPALRAAITATGLAWRVRDSGTQIEMMLIPPGTFQMGCIMGSDAYGCPSFELPVHQVTLTAPIYLGRFEVTQAQWMAKMGSNPSNFQGQSDSASRPVERVSWVAIQDFLVATGMRLPTEAEWEFACRSGTQTPFYNGSTDDSTVGDLGWYAPNSGDQTHAVGGKTPNGFGLYDMLGNVWECVNDWAGAYPSSAQTNPTGALSANQHVVRGGSWATIAANFHSSVRSVAYPGEYSNRSGFRVARNP
jgi:formylglycine-generating enzyme required for sulfatase activity